MNLFFNKYRIPSARLQNWDYRWEGSYFITICTKGREHFFGIIDNAEMHLNEMGNVARLYWMEIPKHFSFVTLDAFIVMPNHVHGIIIINKQGPVETLPPMVEPLQVETLQCNVSTALINIRNEKMAIISPKPGSISTIIRSYKSVVSKNIHKINADFRWQERFHDHVIRDEKSFIKIQNYILTNQEKWNGDIYNKGK